MLIIGSPPIMWGADDPERHHFRCLGSPPLAWGVAVRYGPQHVHPRFTPTRVGIWRDTDRRRISSAVHPHSRGDLLNVATMRFRTGGSPPLAWGFGIRVREHLAEFRFTPTRVGIWFAALFSPPHLSVHPHSRGDLRRSAGSAWACLGSPPLAWGFVVATDEPRPPGRFTPTRVGICTSSTRFSTVGKVHPHSRGDLCPTT